ncbi:MAG: hypothetical protein RLZZ338_1622 [Cyanobacteriota bacterium]
MPCPWKRHCRVPTQIGMRVVGISARFQARSGGSFLFREPMPQATRGQIFWQNQEKVEIIGASLA